MARQQTTKTLPPAAARAEWETGADESAYEDEGRALYPTIQFLLGKPDARGTPAWTGGFFLPADHGIVPNEGGFWMPYTFVTADGSEVAGYLAAEVRIAFVYNRRAWFVRPESGGSRRYPWDEFEAAREDAEDSGARLSGCVQVLCYVQGIGDPVVLTLRGTITRGVTDRAGWFERFRSFVLAPANKSRADRARAERRDAPPPIHPMLFWAHIGVQVGDDGAPVFVKVGEGSKSKLVTRIALIDPQERATDPGAYYVGREAQRAHEAAYQGARQWAGEWKTGTAEAPPPPPVRDPAPQYKDETTPDGAGY